jgi:hypothetical protein
MMDNGTYIGTVHWTECRQKDCALNFYNAMLMILLKHAVCINRHTGFWNDTLDQAQARRCSSWVLQEGTSNLWSS